MPKSEKEPQASSEQLPMANMPTGARGEAEAELRGEEEAGAGAAKVFRPYDPNQVLLLPPNLDEWLPAEHMARLIDDLVENVLDLRAIYADYREARGAPPYHPKLLLKLLLYGYATGIFSSRRLERAAHELVPCRYLTADQQPDHKTISDFRRYLGSFTPSLTGQPQGRPAEHPDVSAFVRLIALKHRHARGTTAGPPGGRPLTSASLLPHLDRGRPTRRFHHSQVDASPRFRPGRRADS